MRRDHRTYINIQKTEQERRESSSSRVSVRNKNREMLPEMVGMGENNKKEVGEEKLGLAEGDDRKTE